VSSLALHSALWILCNLWPEGQFTASADTKHWSLMALCTLGWQHPRQRHWWPCTHQRYCKIQHTVHHLNNTRHAGFTHAKFPATKTPTATTSHFSGSTSCATRFRPYKSPVSMAPCFTYRWGQSSTTS
jgi:hypothetical protein